MGTCNACYKKSLITLSNSHKKDVDKVTLDTLDENDVIRCVTEKELLELKFIDVSDKNPEKSIEGKVLDELNLHKYCCRRMMLSNVHLISYIN
mgnify:CR=1 FL=1